MDKSSALATLKAAYDAADDAYVNARMNDADAASLSTLDNQRQLALHSFIQAMKEELVQNNPVTQKIQTDLDAVTKQLKDALEADKELVQVLGLVDSLVKLAGTLASAFA